MTKVTKIVENVVIVKIPQFELNSDVKTILAKSIQRSLKKMFFSPLVSMQSLHLDRAIQKSDAVVRLDKLY